MLSRTGELVATLVVLVSVCVLEGNCKECQDSIKNCKSYGDDVCQQFKDWSSKNCQKFCGICKEDACRDRVSHCENYLKGDCVQYKERAKRNCPKTCQLCDEVAAGSCKIFGWKLYAGDRTCSKVYAAKSWDDAKTSCKGQGGDLVIIRDQKKNDFISRGLPVGEQFWIGFKNVGANGDDFIFKSVDGAYMGSYHPWETNNPDNWNDEERCVTLNVLTGHKGYWNDLNCSTKKRFVCEMPTV